MDYLSIIRKPIEGEMNDFVRLFNESLSQGEGLLDQVLSHIRQRGGKRMRPMLILLTAKNYGVVSDVTQNAALGLECNLAQNHYYKADDTETRTPSYTLLSLSIGSDLNIHKKKVAEISVTAENLLNRAYQNHLSRLKYTDVNNVTGQQGVFNMGRNIVFKLLIPISF